MSDFASPASYPSSSSSLVPTIDISPFLLNPTSEAANDVCQAIRVACLHTGFFQVIGHGVSMSTMTRAFEASRRFYALPLEEKQKLDITKHLGFRGYDGIGTQSYGGDTLPDLKEVSLYMNSLPPFHSPCVFTKNTCCRVFSLAAMFLNHIQTMAAYSQAQISGLLFRSSPQSHSRSLWKHCSRP